MKNEQHMKPEDWIELREIEACSQDAKRRRARLMNKLRQRAFRARSVQLNKGEVVG